MIRVIAVGKLKDPHLAALAEMYRRRLRPLASLEEVELRDQAPDVAGRQMIAQLGSTGGHEHVVALDESGPQLTSRQLADLLGSHGRVAFLIGGPDGHPDAVRSRADRVLGLSRLTLPHELARVVLMEQIYRGFSILRGTPYHRD
jgi:23S rRNA (pseudouridine1915-N3)-methyltransferase